MHKSSIAIGPAVKIPLTGMIAARGQGVQINLANRKEPGSALRDAAALRTQIGPNYSGPSPTTGALLVELAHTGSLSDPESIVSSGSNIWVGEFASNNIVEIATPADTTTATVALPTGHYVSSMALDSSSKLWFADPSNYSYGYVSGSTATETVVGSTYGKGMSSAGSRENSDYIAR